MTLHCWILLDVEVVVEEWLASTTVATMGAEKSLPLRLWVVGGMVNFAIDCSIDWLDVG